MAAPTAPQAIPYRAWFRQESGAEGLKAVLESELGGDGGAHGELPMEVPGAEARRPPLHQEPPEGVIHPAPDNGHVRDGAVGDPELRAIQHVALADAYRLRLHATGIRAVVRLREAEAPRSSSCMANP